jgi:hypothetical protein
MSPHSSVNVGIGIDCEQLDEITMRPSVDHIINDDYSSSSSSILILTTAMSTSNIINDIGGE